MMSKSLLTFSILTLAALNISQMASAELKEIWTIKEGLAAPESAHFCKEVNSIFVSNINGEATAKDANGFISKIDPSGKVEKLKWVDGLNAPKGLACAKGRLWIADIDQIVSADLKTGKIVDRLEVAGAKFLNDVAAAKNGDIIVSDMLTDTLHVVRNGKVEVLLSSPDLEHPNGLFVESKDNLVVASWGRDMAPDFSTKTPGSLLRLNLKSKKITPIHSAVGNLDGLERISKNRWFITDWVAGSAFEWLGNRTPPKEVLTGLKGAADLGFIKKSNVLLIPEMNQNQLHAYQL